MFCKKFFHFEMVENSKLLEETPIEWDVDTQSMKYAQSKALYVSYKSEVYNWKLDFSFLVAVLFALWTVNCLVNSLRIYLLRIFKHEDLVCENGDTFMFANNLDRQVD
jgi:hypothetical protein